MYFIGVKIKMKDIKIIQYSLKILYVEKVILKVIKLLKGIIVCNGFCECYVIVKSLFICIYIIY